MASFSELISRAAISDDAKVREWAEQVVDRLSEDFNARWTSRVNSGVDPYDALMETVIEFNDAGSREFAVADTGHSFLDGFLVRLHDRNSMLSDLLRHKVEKAERHISLEDIMVA